MFEEGRIDMARNLMVPGDIIEWMFFDDDRHVSSGETMWSTITHTWVPIGPELTHVLISINGMQRMSWVNSKGVFTASLTDAYGKFPSPAKVRVVQ